MTWSYSGDPSTSNKDMVRFLIGDTDTNDQLVSDEEIAAILAVTANIKRAAARILRSLAAKFARDVDIAGEGLRESGSQRAQAFRDMADELDEEADGEAPAVPIAGVRIAGYHSNDVFKEADLEYDNELRQSSN